MGTVDRVAIWALCVASSVALGVACADAGSTGATNVGGTGGSAALSDAGPDAADASVNPPQLDFDPMTTLTLTPKETHELVVRATPAGSFKVRFALIGSDVGDAALDTDEASTDENGEAHVTLTASSMPTTFTVRAAISTKSQARLGVAVSASNYTTLRVLPSYAGKRPISAWTATAAAGVTCASLSGNPPPDGDLSTTASVGDPLVIQQVPVGVALAVTLRAGHYVGGCADQAALSEGDGNQIPVYASDRPVNLTDTQLDVSFGPTNPSAALSQLFSAATSDITTALSAGNASDVTSLLDAMQAATVTASRDAFTASRQTYTWETALTTAFGSAAATRLRAPATRWLNTGSAGFFGAATFRGTLAAHGSDCVFTPETVAGVSADSTGLATSIDGTWSTDSSDTLLLGLTLAWQPSRLLAALAVPAATTEFPTAMSVEEALAASVDCGLVGSTLAAHGSSANAAYTGCDEACVTSTCTQAVAALWQTASAASGNTSAALPVTASGACSVADDASISQLAGSWVGQLGIGKDNANAGGPFSGAAPSN